MAYRPFDFVSVGANFSYVFGTTTNDAYAYTTDGSTTLFERVIDVRDWGVQLGVQFSKVFAKKHDVAALLGYSQEWESRSSLTASRKKVLIDGVDVIDGGTEDMQNSGNVQEWALRHTWRELHSQQVATWQCAGTEI